MMGHNKDSRPDELRLIRAGVYIGGGGEAHALRRDPPEPSRRQKVEGRASSAPSLQGHPDTQGEARRSVRNRLSVKHKIAAGGIAHRADPDATSEAPEIKPYHGRAVEA